ncbi:MAG: F0F1 ATP synthase subunit B [Cellulomonadaceae bacterium]|jgi:F-type H+-transporting ATPase subunit b|nr:F0F1 ATP synthase subunit B [Cellulomonadaceae bacterium]
MAAWLSAATVLVAAEEPAQGIDLLIPAKEDMFWSAVVLIIIGVVFYKMVLPMMNKVLDERAALIEGGLKKAERAQAAADKALENRQEMMEQARAEIAAARDEAREQGKAIVAEQRQSAMEEAQRIVETAQRQIEAERQAAEVSLKSDVGQLATDLASKIVGESLSDDAAKSRVVDRFLDDLEVKVK